MKYRRSIFLIDRPFQLRFSTYVCSWLIALSFVYPLIVHSLFDYFLRFASLDPMGPSVATIQRTRSEIFSLLVLLQIVFLGFTFLISIFMSHRIAGPIFKLRQFIDRAKNGSLKEELYFRKKDHFRGLADDYNEMMQGIRGVFEKNVDILSSAIPQLEETIAGLSGDRRAQMDAIISALKERRDANQTRLG